MVDSYFDIVYTAHCCFEELDFESISHMKHIKEGVMAVKGIFGTKYFHRVSKLSEL